MTRVDLHPEELFDQLRAGQLSAADSARLDGHCRSCAACRLELQLANVARGAEPSAVDRALADAVTSRMLDPVSQPRPLRAAGRSGRSLGRWAFAAALGCSMSAAAFWSGVPQAALRAIAHRLEQTPPAPAAAARPSGPPPSAPSVTEPLSAPAAQPPAPQIEVAATPRPLRRRATRSEPAPQPPLPATPPTAAVPQPPAAEPPGPVRAAAPPISIATPLPAVVASAPAKTPEAPPERSTSSGPSARAPAPRTDAQALLRAAASARSAGDYERAAESYQRLLDEYPRSSEASIARVPYARILCQRLDEASDALRMFESYLRDESHGSLRQEALSGQAQCLESDGRAAEARRVWQQILRDHPDSVYAKRARARLGSP